MTNINIDIRNIENQINEIKEIFELILIFPMSKLNAQVLIVGAGPVGMISALSLARAGIHSIIVERHRERRNAPKAHAINARTLEICERLGLSADKIRGTGASIEDGGLVHFVDTLSSTHFGCLPYERQDDGAREFTPWPLVNIAQPVFECFLQEAFEYGLGDVH